MPAPATSRDSDILANYLLEQLVGTVNATLPAIDLFDAAHTIPWTSTSAILNPVEKLEITELVANFDALMTGFGAQLQKEYDAQRITGAKYADTYVMLTQAAMQSAIQFTLGRDQAFWMAAKGQADAITAMNQNEAVKLQTMLARAQYALTKLKLATEDSAFGASDYSLNHILPANLKLTQEQTNSTAAQTSDTRVAGDTNPVAGLLKTQKDLYAQQIKSYQADTQIKAAKIFSDLWALQHTASDAEPPGAISPADEPGISNYNNTFGHIFNLIPPT